MTCRRIIVTAFALASAAAAIPALAQDDPTEAGRTLPPICTAAAMDMGSPMKMGTSGMDPEHQDLMKGMDQMNANMGKGMMAKDIDVAFVCGMIAHHQGAIDMAKAELAHGDDTWAKDSAQKVIDAQAKEIADMLGWLKRQSN